MSTKSIDFLQDALQAAKFQVLLAESALHAARKRVTDIDVDLHIAKIHAEAAPEKAPE